MSDPLLIDMGIEELQDFHKECYEFMLEFQEMLGRANAQYHRDYLDRLVKKNKELMERTKDELERRSFK